MKRDLALRVWTAAVYHLPTTICFSVLLLRFGGFPEDKPPSSGVREGFSGRASRWSHAAESLGFGGERRGPSWPNLIFIPVFCKDQNIFPVFYAVPKVSRNSPSSLGLESSSPARQPAAAKHMTHFPGAGIQEPGFPYQPVGPGWHCSPSSSGKPDARFCRAYSTEIPSTSASPTSRPILRAAEPRA